MLFTRSPFALADTNVVAGVKPLATLTVTFDVAAGINRSGIRYAS